MSQLSPMGFYAATALIATFGFTLLSVLFWRFPSAIGSRFVLGIVLGLVTVVSVVLLSESVTMLVAELGYSKMVASWRPK